MQTTAPPVRPPVDVIVIGAGMAGLACAGDLTAAGRRVVLEAGDGPGGRMRTDRLYVCGDYRATGSLQGAMASGARAARQLLADTGYTRCPAAARTRPPSEEDPSPWTVFC